jgi:hypothetical protein
MAARHSFAVVLPAVPVMPMKVVRASSGRQSRAAWRSTLCQRR